MRDRTDEMPAMVLGPGTWTEIERLHFAPSLGIFPEYSSYHTRPVRVTKLIALYRKPSDPESFDEHYDRVHTPLVRKYPGLKKLELTRVSGAPIGDTKYHLLAEMYFENRESMEKALASPEGKAVARDLMSFAADTVIVFFGEVDS
jgi:uncharacterized protein (TIGR02118 family)